MENGNEKIYENGIGKMNEMDMSLSEIEILEMEKIKLITWLKGNIKAIDNFCCRPHTPETHIIMETTKIAYQNVLKQMGMI